MLARIIQFLVVLAASTIGLTIFHANATADVKTASFTPAVGNKALLKIAGFLRARMWQTNASAGGTNMLNVLLATNVDVPAVVRCLPSSHQHLQCVNPRCLLTLCFSLCAK